MLLLVAVLVRLLFSVIMGEARFIVSIVTILTVRSRGGSDVVVPTISVGEIVNRELGDMEVSSTDVRTWFRRRTRNRLRFLIGRRQRVRRVWRAIRVRRVLSPPRISSRLSLLHSKTYRLARVRRSAIGEIAPPGLV